MDKNISDIATSSTASSQKEEAPKTPGPRERILDAALELFVEQGYFNTNVPDISRRSKCSVGSIYHHFRNKEEIAADLYQLGIEQFRTAVSGAISSSESNQPEDLVKTIVIAFLCFAESHQRLARYLWLARHNEFLSVGVRKPTVVGFDPLGRQLAKVIKNGIRAGTIPNIKAEIFWSIVFGIPLSYVRDWLEGYTDNSPTQVAPTLASACWSALAGANPGN